MKRFCFLIIFIMILSLFSCKEIIIDDNENENNNNEIINDKLISSLMITFNKEEKVINLDNDNVISNISEGERKYNSDRGKDVIIYEVVLNTNGDYTFSSDIVIKWNDSDYDDIKLEDLMINSNNIKFNFVLEFDVVKDISIILDTENYIVKDESIYYDSEIIKPLNYIVIKIEVKIYKELSVDYLFIVNDEIISDDKYELVEDSSGYIIKYKINDPNWTPFF